MRKALKTPRNLIRLSYDNLLKCPKELSLHSKIRDSVGIDGQGMLIVEKIPEAKNLRRDIFKCFFEMYQNSEERKRLTNTHIDNELGWVERPAVHGGPFDVFSYMSRIPSDVKKMSDFKNQADFEYDYRWPKSKFHCDSIFKCHNLVTEIGKHLIKHVNEFLNKEVRNFDNLLINSVKSWNCTHREIIYPPLPKNSDFSREAYHTDVSLFTTVFHPIYLDKNLREYPDMKHSCLIFKDSKGEEYEAEYQEDELVINFGDMFFFLSAGQIPTSFHTVRSDLEIQKDLYRSNIITFLEPLQSQPIKIGGGIKFDDISNKHDIKYFSKSNLEFRDGMTFGEFEINFLKDGRY